MEEKSNFNDLPRVSVKTLFNDEFIESISILIGIDGNYNIKLTSADGNTVNLDIGRNTRQKFNVNFNEDKLISDGHIVLIDDLALLSNLRFYISDYQDFIGLFELDLDEKIKIEKQSKLIKEILFRNFKKAAEPYE
jgi:hypothetical protein